MNNFSLFYFRSFIIVLFLVLANLNFPSTAIAATIFTDDFNDLDGTSLTTHNSAWTITSPGPVPEIQSNYLYIPSSSEGTYTIMTPVNQSPTDACISVDVLFPINNLVYLFARQGSGEIGDPRYYAFLNPADTGFGLVYQPSPDTTNYLVNYAGVTPAAGWHTYKMCTIGTRISVYLDDTVLGDVTNSNVMTGGPFAFLAGSGDYFDNFLLEGVTSQVNNAPVVGSISALPNPVQTGTEVNISASFTDQEITDTHTVVWNWGDGSTSTGTVSENNGTGSVTGAHIYSTAGVYTVTVTVTDSKGASGVAVYEYQSVYNPTAHAVFSAGQKYTSPMGAVAGDLSASGIVRFGLNYTYEGTVPVGTKQFSFSFDNASLYFNAQTVDDLVITTDNARLSGTGTLNGQSGYNYLVLGTESSKTIRIRISDSNGGVIYDTQPGASTTALPTTSVTGRVRVEAN